jgi:hypothetical protein
MASYIGSWNVRRTKRTSEPQPPEFVDGVLTVVAEANARTLDGTIAVDGANYLVTGDYLETSPVWEGSIVWGDSGVVSTFSFVLDDDGDAFGGTATEGVTGHVTLWSATRIANDP